VVECPSLPHQLFPFVTPSFFRHTTKKQPLNFLVLPVLILWKIIDLHIDNILFRGVHSAAILPSPQLDVDAVAFAPLVW
jgi:hypothetical protein